MTPNETAEREAFEQWLRENVYPCHTPDRWEADGSYSHDGIRHAWLAWKARAASPVMQNGPEGETSAVRERPLACPTCGDSTQTIEVAAPDHGERRSLRIAWCMDCLCIRGWSVGGILPPGPLQSGLEGETPRHCPRLYCTHPLELDKCACAIEDAAVERTAQSSAQAEARLREEFAAEARGTKHGHGWTATSLRTMRKDGRYANSALEYQWQAWLIRRAADATPAPAEPALVEAARKSAGLLEHALEAMHHAYTEPNWFTDGERGARRQFFLWHQNGTSALAELRRALGEV